MKWLLQANSQRVSPKLPVGAARLISAFTTTDTNSYLIAVSAEIDTIEPFYQLRERERVRAFLQDHKNLLPLLLEAPSVIEQIFGRTSQLTLEVRSDPEDEVCAELFIYVQTPCAPKDAWAKLKQLIDDWLIYQAQISEGLLGVNLEYV
jgi:hypothetical protein